MNLLYMVQIININRIGGNIYVQYLSCLFQCQWYNRKSSPKVGQQIHADLFKIQPKQAYTRADLNWNDSHSRSTLEMKDPNSRPEILNKVEKMEQYNTVFVGFPIWWYREPSIIDTFIESYDLVNKTIIPFATSGGSGMGKSSTYIQKLAPKSKVTQGKRLSFSITDEELNTWACSMIK